jgi:hypothetical protein
VRRVAEVRPEDALPQLVVCGLETAGEEEQRDEPLLVDRASESRRIALDREVGKATCNRSGTRDADADESVSVRIRRELPAAPAEPLESAPAEPTAGVHAGAV